jgi:hypothetical protein
LQEEKIQKRICKLPTPKAPKSCNLKTATAPKSDSVSMAYELFTADYEEYGIEPELRAAAL